MVLGVVPEEIVKPPVPEKFTSDAIDKSPPRVISLAEPPAAIDTLFPVIVKLLDNARLPPKETFLAEPTALIVKPSPCVVNAELVEMFPPNVIDLPVAPVLRYKPPVPDKTRSDEISILPSSVNVLDDV